MPGKREKGKQVGTHFLVSTVIIATFVHLSFLHHVLHLPMLRPVVVKKPEMQLVDRRV